MSFLKLKNKIYLGLDITPTHVKIVEISGSLNNITLENYVIHEMPSHAFQDGHFSELDTISNAVKEAWQKLKTNNKLVATALPFDSVNSKQILVQADISPEDMYAQVSMEIAQSIPFKLDEVNFDYRIIGLNLTQPEYNDVIWIAGKKDKIEERLAVLETAGLTAKILDIDNRTILSSLVSMESENDDIGNVLHVSINNTNTITQILREDNIIYDREVHNLNMNNFLRSYANHLDIPINEAYHHMLHEDIDSHLEMQVIRPFFDSVYTEINRSKQFFINSSTYTAISKVIISGEGANIPGIDDFLAEKLEVNVEVANPMKHIKIAKNVSKEVLLYDAPLLMTAFGLALRSFHP